MDGRMARVEEKVDQIEDKIDKLDTKFDKMDERLTAHLMEPAENWNKVKWLIISTLVVAIIGLILTMVGLNL